MSKMRRAQRRKYHFVYKTICLITNRYYYGMHSTDDLDDGYLGSGKRLKYSINKYGKDNHRCEKVEFLESRELLRKREKEIVNEELLNDPLCMNLSIGGEGGSNTHGRAIVKDSNGHIFNVALDDERYTSGKLKGVTSNMDYYKDPNYRKNLSEKLKDYNKRYGNPFTGKKHTSEYKKHMSKIMSIKHAGVNNPSYGTCWITNEKENKKIYKGDDIPSGWRLGRKMKL